MTGEGSTIGPSSGPAKVAPAEPANAPCPVCGATNTRIRRNDVHDFEYFIEPTVHLVVRCCSECGSEFLSPRPSASDLVDFYPPDYHAYNEDPWSGSRELSSGYARVGLGATSICLTVPGDGCSTSGAGDCRHFDELRRVCDLDCAGVELNPVIAARGRARGYDIVDGTLEEMDITDHLGRYDFVSMNHVLEHVLEPQVAVERARQLLRPGGHLFGQLPTLTSWEASLFGYRWGGYHFPRHLQMFSRYGLRNLLESGGFSQVKIHSAPHLQTALSLQHTLISRGWRPRMRFGKTPIYGALLVAAAPFEVVAYSFDRGGIIDFSGQKAH